MQSKSVVFSIKLGYSQQFQAKNTKIVDPRVGLSTEFALTDPAAPGSFLAITNFFSKNFLSGSVKKPYCM